LTFNSVFRIIKTQHKSGSYQTMGLRVWDSFEIVDVQEDVQRQELADIESLLDEAARNRPELWVALAQIAVQRAGVKAAEACYWPAVSFGTDVGVVLDAPLFTGFDRTYQVHRAKADLARVVAGRQSILRSVELEVWTAYLRIIESNQAIDAASRFVASAEESARIAEGEYKNGTGSIIGLIPV
jgi:outer membrane protein